MAGPRKSTQKLDVYKTIRTDEWLKGEMEYGAGRLGESEIDSLRRAAEIGYKFLRMIDYDVAGAVVEKALRALRKEN